MTDMRILSVLLIIGVVGSFAAVPSSDSRTRRSVAVTADEPLARVHRVERDVAASKNGSKETSESPSTPAPSNTPQESDAKTSSTPKPKETSAATPAPSSSESSSTPKSSAESTEGKPAVAESKSSTPDTDSNNASPSLSARSNFNEDERAAADHHPNEKSRVSTTTVNMNLPPINAVPNVNGWAQSGANTYANSAATGYAGTGSFYVPAGSPLLQGRSAFIETEPSIYPRMANNAAAGASFYNPDPFVQSNFGTDPASFQRLMEQHFQYLQAQLEAQHRAKGNSDSDHPSPRIWEASNSIAGGYPGSGFPTGVYASGPGTAPSGPQSAHSVISVGPRGGFQAGAINPVGPGVESRFAEDVPAPSGNSFGVFSSSSTSTRIGPDGQPISHKSSTTGVNDNGKITFRTVQD